MTDEKEMINPDIAKQVTTVGIVKATVIKNGRGVQRMFAVVQRVTFPQWVIENVESHNVYQGTIYSLRDALEVIDEEFPEMP